MDSFEVNKSETISSTLNTAINHSAHLRDKAGIPDAKTVPTDEILQFLDATTVKGINWSKFDTKADPFYKHSLQDGKAADYQALV